MSAMLRVTTFWSLRHRANAQIFPAKWTGGAASLSISARNYSSEVGRLIKPMKSSTKMSAGASFILLAAHFVLPLLQPLNSNAFTYVGEGGMVEAVVFTDFSSQFVEPYNLLYFKAASRSLDVHCQLRNRSSDNKNTRNALGNQYYTQGMSPTITLITPDWSISYKFDEFIVDENVYWKLNISKDELLAHCEETLRGKIPWAFKVELGQGLNLFECWGTVVIPDIEPLLSVQLGDSLTESNEISAPTDVIVWQHPCTPGVAVLAPLLEVGESFTGGYLAVTHGIFKPNTTHWYDLLHRSSGRPDNYSICKEVSFSACEKLSILDFTVVDNYILLVTTKGLIRSESMADVAKGFNKTKLKLYQVANIHSIIDQAFKDGTVEYGKIKLYHSAQCDGHDISIKDHLTNLIYTPAYDEPSILLTSEPPFDKWSSFELVNPLKEFPVFGVAWDIQRNAMVLLMKEPNKVRSLVSVLDPETSQLLQPVFQFPENATITKITFHAHSHVIFVYGSQVWQSLDGGNSFETLLDTHLRHDSVSSLFANSLGDAFALVTSLGAVSSGWSGIPRVSQIESATTSSNCSFKIASFQHRKAVDITCIRNTSNVLTFKTYRLDSASQIKADRIVIFRPLLVNFFSEREVEFLAFCGDAFFTDLIGCVDSFQESDVGRILRTRNGGSALITGVEHTTDTNDFSALVTGLIIKPIATVAKSDSPVLHCTLQVNITGLYAYLQLQNSVNDSGWRGEDIGKTLRLSSGISLIVTACESLISATGRLPASWKNTETYSGVYEEGTWFLIDLRPFHASRPVSSPVLRVYQTENGSAQADIVSNDQFLFSNENVGEVLKYERGWGVITSVSNASVSILKAGILIPGNYTNNWGIYKADATMSKESYIPYIPNPQFQGWWLVEDECRHFLVEDPPSQLKVYHLDSGESLSFTLRVTSKGITDENPSKPLLRVYIANILLFHVESSYKYSNMNHTLKVNLTKRPFISGISSISVELHQTAPLLCKKASYTVHGDCPPTKMLRFLYPLSFSLDHFLNAEIADSKGIVRNLKLPFNYRAPSPRGKAIPMSKNAYNVDPQKPLYKTTYAVTRSTLMYKQCQGKDRRSDCGCTNQMRGSSLVKHSDCIDTVYRMMFSETLTPRFVVLQEHRVEQPLRFPFYLEELNQRRDFTILSASELTFSGLSSPVLKQELNSSIQFEGSGLYHFRARVVQENYTFCSLTDDFMVFVVDTPLAFPVNDVVRACTGMGFATLLFFVYMRHFHGKKKMKND